MGLDILEQKLQEIRTKDPTGILGNKLWGYGVAGLICLDEFLAFLFKLDPALLAEFNALLTTFIATGTAFKAAVELTITQLEVASQLANVFLQTFETLEAGLLSKLSLFPFGNDQFAACPPVQALKNFVTAHIPSSNALLPKRFKNVAATYKKLKYDVIKFEKNIERLRIVSQQIDLEIQFCQAVQAAISKQFPSIGSTFI